MWRVEFDGQALVLMHAAGLDGRGSHWQLRRKGLL